MTQRDMLLRIFPFEPGTRVRVVKQIGYSKYKLLNKIGVIQFTEYGKFAVKFDDVYNLGTSQGVFYISGENLKLATTNDNDILEDNNMPNITNYLNIEKIQYVYNTATSRYDYANFDPELKVDDLCVVMSVSHGMGLAKVVEIIDRNDIETPREIVGKVNTDAYYERVNVRSKAAELKAKMQERAKKLQDIALFQMLAKEDSEMAEMLKAYQGLI